MNGILQNLMVINVDHVRISDLTRLRDMRRELREETSDEFNVRWVDECLAVPESDD